MSAMARSSLRFFLVVAILISAVFFSPAIAGFSPRWEAITLLTQAQGTADESAKSRLLESALKNLKNSPDLKKDPDVRAKAIELIESAISGNARF